MAGDISRKNGKKGGRPKGTHGQRVLDRMKMKARLEQRILRAADRLATAQIHIATGQTFLYKIEKEEIIGPKGGKSYRNKKPVLVTSQYEIESYLNGIAEGDPNDDSDPTATYYYMTTKEPNNEALKDLWNRVHGMPKATIDTNVNVTFSLKDLAARREALQVPSKIIDQSQSPHELQP